jgi:hypothetical protein
VCRSRVPIPADSFLHDQDYLGYRYGGRRWRSRDGERLYTWDDVHEHVEVFNKRGRHLGVLEAVTGVRIGDAVKGRTIDV